MLVPTPILNYSMRKLLLITIILMYACGGNEEDKWQYIDKFNRVDKKTEESWTKKKVSLHKEEDFANFPPHIQRQIDSVKSLYPYYGKKTDLGVYKRSGKIDKWDEYEESLKKFKWEWVKD